MLVFSHTFPVQWKFTFPMFWVLGIVSISASREICEKHLTLKCFVFSYFSLTIRIYFPHVLGTILLIWRLMKNFYFWSHFVYLKLFTKEINLFCCWARSNICISDPLVIEAWKYIQCRSLGSVIHGR